MPYINRINTQILDSNSPRKSIIICQIALKNRDLANYKQNLRLKNITFTYTNNPVFCGLCKESWCIKAVFIKKSLQNDIFSILIAIFAKEL